jgi:hypothetical protein
MPFPVIWALNYELQFDFKKEKTLEIMRYFWIWFFCTSLAPLLTKANRGALPYACASLCNVCFSYFYLSACLCTTPGTVNASINCDDNGGCSCKRRVIGDKCSHGQNGTFNLANDNQYGCTVCMCSGITQNCTSSSLYRSKVRDLKFMSKTKTSVSLPPTHVTTNKL